MPKKSAGILLYRFHDEVLNVFLVHPGGPFWSKKDEWMIPKGEFDEDEEPLSTAKREFTEETGFSLTGEFVPMTPIRQSGGKMVYAFAFKGNIDVNAVHSNEFELEWPPKSGKKKMFPEIDRAQWFTIEEAKKKILKSQQPLLTELETILKKR